MDEGLFLQAAENRKRRDHLRANIDEVSAAVSRVSNNGGRVMLQCGGPEGASAEISAGLLWKALDQWLDEAKQKVLNLDSEFYKL